jgi:hypothetical protein
MADGQGKLSGKRSDPESGHCAKLTGNLLSSCKSAGIGQNVTIEARSHPWFLRHQRPMEIQIRFCSCLHWRDPIEIELDSGTMSRALRDQLEAILATPLGQWTKIATGYKKEWGMYSKAQFEAMGLSYPSPKSIRVADRASTPPASSGRLR